MHKLERTISDAKNEKQQEYSLRMLKKHDTKAKEKLLELKLNPSPLENCYHQANNKER